MCQGDQEYAYGLPPSPFMDRSRINVPKSQVRGDLFVISL